MVTVSVIIPTYNAGRLIERALDSVLQQVFSNYEIIVVDDGSEDHTQQLMVSYRGQLSYVYQRHAGAASARNQGIKLAKGRYVAFLDADDEWHPNKLQKQVSFLEDNEQADWLFSDLSESRNGKITHKSYLHELNYQHVSGGYVFEKLLRECFIFTPTVIVKKEALSKSGLFNPDLQVFEDYDLWLRLAKNHEVGYIDEPLVTRHIHEQNLTSNQSLIFSGYSDYLDQLFHDTDLTVDQRAIIERERNSWNRLAGMHYLEKGEAHKARLYISKNLQRQKDLKTTAMYILCMIKPDYSTWVVNLLRKLRKLV